MTTNNFEYLDSESIDEELKCSICYQPFHLPICDSRCGHTFCQECLKESLKNCSVCPICRRDITIEDFQPVQTRIVLNQLSRLRMKCTLCGQMNIDDRRKHLETCPKQMIKCSSADIQCLWKGHREDLSNHLEKCPFEQIRPLIDQLNQEIQKIKKNQCEQQSFIKAFINNGYTLSQICSADDCYLKRSIKQNQARLMPCSLCDNRTHCKQVALHSCHTFNCICKSCFDQHYPQTLKRNRRRRRSSFEQNTTDDNNSSYRRRRRYSRSSSSSPSPSPLRRRLRSPTPLRRRSRSRSARPS